MIEDCEGYKSLAAAIKHDCDNGGEGCFNPKGCDKEAHRYADGHCYCNIKCFHQYCNKLKWVIERVQHYAEKTGVSAEAILDSWEKRRNYWYMNYYQDATFPLIEGDKVKVFDTREDLIKSLDGKGFRCPNCAGISKDPYACDSGVLVHLINAKNKKKKDPCNWKAYGLFRTFGKGVTVFVKENMALEEIFMPVAWEKQ